MSEIFVASPMAPIGTNWGPWVQSEGIIVPTGTTFDVTLDLSVTSAFPPSTVGGGSTPASPFRAEFRYFDGTNFVTESVVFTPDGGSHTISVGEGISTIGVRTNTMAGAALAQEIRIGNSNLDFGFPDEQGIIDFGGNDDYADWFDNILDDIGQAISDFPGELPQWVQDLPIWGIPGFNLGPGLGGGGLDPLVFDLDGDGLIELTNLNTNGVHFDFWNDGYVEATGWVAPDDGMLAWDIDGSGDINTAAELFGSSFPIGFINDSNLVDLAEENGFARLGKQDLIINGGNEDGIIDANDAIWTQLDIWQDVNQDGVSQAGELLSLDSLGIASIDVTNYALDSFNGFLNGGFLRVIEGNTVTHTGTFTMNDSSTREVVDVWFNSNLQDTYYAEPYTLDVRTLFLPTLRGYGQIPDLHIAMSLDNGSGGLLEQVQAFAGGRTFEQNFGEFDTVRTEMRDILMKWAGINDPAGPNYSEHGVFSSMAEFLFLRKLAGQDSEFFPTWFDGGVWMPRPQDGIEGIFDSWNNVLDSLSARMVFQSGGSALFEPGTTYNPISDVFEGPLTLSQAAISQLQATATGHADVEGFWHSVALFLDATKGVSNLTAGEEIWLDNAVNVSSASSLSWSDIEGTLVDQVTIIQSTDTLFTGSDYDDVMDKYWLATGNLDSVGGAGNDRLFGWNGDDILDGGIGNDILKGGWGNDTYRYDYGHDVIVEEGGNSVADTNIIEFGAGILTSDVSLHLARMDFGLLEAWHVVLEVQGRGTITIELKGSGGSTLPIQMIDELHFADGTIINMVDMPATLHGTSGNDNLFSSHWASVVTQYDPGAGNDIVYGSTGNDIYILSAGVDTITDGGGYDVIKVPHGSSLSDVEFFRISVDGGPYDDASFVVDGLGTLVFPGAFINDPLSGKSIEVLQLADGTHVDLTTQVYKVVGTNGDDTILDNGGWQGSSDVYVFGQGNDIILESYGGTDTILFGEGVSLSDLSIARFQGVNSLGYPGNHLVVKDQNGNSLTIIRHFEYSNASIQETNLSIEKLEFADGTIINLSDIEIEAHGTEGNDQIQDALTGDASPDDTIFGHGGNDSIYPGLGNDIVYGGTGDDYISDYFGDDILHGEDGNDTIYGTYGNDELYGGSGDDLLYGDGIYSDAMGDDILSGGAGNDILRGGNGFDEALFSGVFANYVITDNTNHFIVEDTAGTDGTDTLYDVERFVFSDGVYENGVFTPSGPTIIASEDFEGGASGWSNNQTDNTESASFTEFLGRFGNGNGSQQLFKNFTLDGAQSQITIEFDFYRIDSWDNEPFNIYLNDNLVLTETYEWNASKTAASGTFTGGTWERDAGTIDHYGFTTGSGENWWKDGIYHYTLTLNTTDTVLKLGFGVSLDEAVANNESFGIDNLVITSDGGSGAPVNHDPVAQNDNFTGTQDVAVTGNVLADNGNGVDSDPDSDPLNVVAATGLATAQGGSVDILIDGSFTYTPASGFIGADSFSYTLEDGQGGSDTGTVNLTVNPLGAPIAGLQASYYVLSSSPSVISDIDFNAAPDATEIVTSINQSTSGSFFTGGPSNNFAAKYEGYLNVVQAGDYTLKMTSDDGSALWIDGVKVIDNDGLHGARSIGTTLSLSAGLHALQAQYFEAGGDAVMKLYWNGPDSGNQEVLISGGALSHGAAVNNDPIAQDDNFTSTQDVAVTGNVLADNGNGADSDLDGNPLNVVAATGLATAQGGSVDILTDGSFTYTPGTGFTGADSFSYTLEDGQGGSDAGTVNLTINAPSSSNIITDEDFEGGAAGWSNNQTDATESASFTEFLGRFGNGNGSQQLFKNFTLDGSQSQITVEFDFYRIDSWDNEPFNIYLNDNLVLTETYVWSAGKTAASGTFADGTWERDAGTIGHFGFTGGSSGADWWKDGIYHYKLTLNTTDTVLKLGFGVSLDEAIANNESFGIDNLLITTDGGSGTPVNNDPVAQNDNFTGTQDVAVTGNVLADNGNGVDSDIDGNPLNVVAATGLATTQGGSVDILTDGSFTYTPGTGFTGADNFSYTLEDGQGGSDTGTVNLTINAPNASNIITNEDFEGGASGWSNNQTDNTESASFTEFLGRFGNSTSVSKTYALSGDQTQLTVAFDFYKIDSWDNEAFRIFVDGNQVLSQNFQINPSGDGSGSFAGGTWERTQMDAGHLGFGNDHGYWVDAVYHYELTLDNSNTSLELGFGGNLNEPVPNESFGIDKLVIATNGSAPGEQLYGTSGADVFAWLLEDVGSAIDVVHEFNAGQGDALDVSDILTGYDPLADLIADFVQITDNGTNSFLAVDADGGADNFVQIATLANVTGLTNEDALEASGNLIGV